MPALPVARWSIPIALCLFAGFGPPATLSAQQAAAPPQWFRDHLAEMIAGTGRWITDNSPWRSENEPFDQYGTEWRYGTGKWSMTGRLFGLRAGEEVATFWEFRVYWHPGRKEAVVEQFGLGGVVGVGPLRLEGPGTVSEQTFWDLTGAESRIRHLAVTTGDEHRTDSFDWKDGGWVPRRSYVWRRTVAR